MMHSTHKVALEEASANIRELDNPNTLAEELSRQVVVLKEKKEKLASELFEAEVEILEIKEATEKAEDAEHQAQHGSEPWSNIWVKQERNQSRL